MRRSLGDGIHIETPVAEGSVEVGRHARRFGAVRWEAAYRGANTAGL
jgi:hypothetical protein